MATQLGLYQKACNHLGAERVASLTEDVKARYDLDAVYDDCLAGVLEKANWKCALRTSSLTYDTAVTPAFGKPYAIAQPSDFVRLANFNTSDFFGIDTELNDFDEEGGVWYCNVQTVYVRYVSNDAAYGLNIAAWPQRLADYAGMDLALRSAIPITKDRGDRNDLMALSERKLAECKTLDAIGDPVKRRPSGVLVTSRLAGRGRRIDPLRS